MQQERQKLSLSSPIPQPLDNISNAKKLSNNSERTVTGTNLQWIIISALAIVIILLIFLYMDAVL
jgi:hypothetical protein